MPTRMPLAWGTTDTLIVIAVVVLIWVATTYNRFVRGRNRVRESFSGVDVQLKRRHDLVPNLVKVVQAYAEHEHDTFEDVVKARGAAAEAQKIPDREQREAALSKSIDKLMILVESYPNLKADQNFRDLQKDLVEIEDHLQYARRYYNGTVRDYNTSIQRFPSVVLAGLFNQKEQPFFQLDDDRERAAPQVSMDA